MRHGQSSGGRCGRASPKYKQCLAGITTKKPSMGFFPARLWDRSAVADQPVLLLSEPDYQRGRQGLAYLTALLG